MRQYILRRLLLFIPTAIGVSLIIFVLMRIVPGDPAVAILAGFGGQGSFTQEDVERLRTRLGLDRPIIVQYADWVANAARLDFGRSLRTSVPVSQEIGQRYPLTLELAILATTMSLAIAIPIGTISALRQDTPIDYGLRVFSIFGLAMPVFFTATLVVLVLSRFFQWSTPLGLYYLWSDPVNNLKQFIFPALCLSYFLSATLARMTRSQVLEVLRQDYVRTARAKGLADQVVVVRHVLKNAMLPVITLSGLQLGALLGGAIVMEMIFTIPGMGDSLIMAVFNRDFPVVQAEVLILALTYLVINLVVDLLYGVLDPRIRYQ